MRSIIKVLTCVLLALVVFVPVRTSWAHEYTPAEKKMIDDYTALFVLKDIDTENMQLIGYEGSSYTLYEDDGIHKDYDKKENYRVLTK